jgi:hypothetical protein
MEIVPSLRVISISLILVAGNYLLQQFVKLLRNQTHICFGQ